MEVVLPLDTKLCACGCGEEIPLYHTNNKRILRRYKNGHNRKGKLNPDSIKARRAAAGGTKPCDCGCGEDIQAINARGKPAKYKSGHNLRGMKIPPESIRRGAQCWNWKGGVRVAKGYVWIRMPDHPDAGAHGYIKRSRLVMEQHLGRPLERHEIVHHINGNKEDDRRENLRLVTKTQHGEIHKPMIDMGNRVCYECQSKADTVIYWHKRPDKDDDIYECGNCHKKRLRKEEN
jgi:hypothetical protein